MCRHEDTLQTHGHENKTSGLVLRDVFRLSVKTDSRRTSLGEAHPSDVISAYHHRVDVQIICQVNNAIGNDKRIPLLETTKMSWEGQLVSTTSKS